MRGTELTDALAGGTELTGTLLLKRARIRNALAA
jgi:hypothetical protein